MMLKLALIFVSISVASLSPIELLGGPIGISVDDPNALKALKTVGANVQLEQLISVTKQIVVGTKYTFTGVFLLYKNGVQTPPNLCKFKVLYQPWAIPIYSTVYKHCIPILDHNGKYTSKELHSI